MKVIGAIGAFAIGALAIGAASTPVSPGARSSGTIGRDAIGALAIGATEAVHPVSTPNPPAPVLSFGLDGVIGSHAMGAYNRWLRQKREDEALVLGRIWLA